MTRFAIACAIGFASVVGFAVLPASAAEPDPMLARVGAEMFQQYCASCHGTSADGKGPVAPALKTLPADLTRIAARRGGEFPDAEISRWIDGLAAAPATAVSTTAVSPVQTFRSDATTSASISSSR